MAMSACPACSAFWLEGSPTCRFCGHDPSQAPAPPPPPGGHWGPGPGVVPEEHLGNGLRGPVSPKLHRRLGWVVLGAFALVFGAAWASEWLAPRGPDAAGNHELSAVCDGEGDPDAAAYDADAGADGLLVLWDQDDGWNARDEAPQDPATIDLVACRAENEGPNGTKRCSYRDQDGYEFTVTVIFHGVTLEVREAMTGTVVERHDVRAEVACPTSMFVMSDQLEKDVYAESEVDEVLDGYRSGGGTDTGADAEG